MLQEPQVTAACHILGVSLPTSLEHLRAAFRRRALESHPDKGGTDKFFQEVIAAYETLIAWQKTDPLWQSVRSVSIQRSTVGFQKTPQSYTWNKQKSPKGLAETPPKAPSTPSRSSCSDTKRARAHMHQHNSNSKQNLAPTSSEFKFKRQPACLFSAAPGCVQRFITEEAYSQGKNFAPASASPLPTASCRASNMMIVRGRPLLERLWKLLKALSPQRRYRVLAKTMSQKQRLILEHWVLQKTSPSYANSNSGSAETACSAVAKRDGSSSSVGTMEHAYSENSEDVEMIQLALPVSCECNDQFQLLAIEDHTYAQQSFDTLDHFGLTRSEQGEREFQTAASDCCNELQKPHEDGFAADGGGFAGSLTRGVVRFADSGRATRYCAVVVIHTMRIQSRKVKELDRAIEFHMVLTDIKHRLVERVHGSGKDAKGSVIEDGFEAKFLRSIEAALREHDISSAEIRLRTRIIIPARYWIGENLPMPELPVEDSLPLWRRLRDARGRIHSGSPIAFLNHVSPVDLEQIWLQFRDVYVEVLRICGETSVNLDILSKRLDTLYLKRQPARELAEQRWNLAQMAREDRQAGAMRRARETSTRREEVRMHQLHQLEARQARRERHWMAREEHCQRMSFRKESRREARELRRMTRCDRESRGGSHWRARECREVIAERRINMLLVCWARYEHKVLSVQQKLKKRNFLNMLRKQKAAVKAAEAKRKHLRAQRRLERLEARRRRTLAYQDLTMDEIMGKS